MINIEDRTISTVAVVDDDPGARESYEYVLQDAHVTPVGEAGPLGQLADFVGEAKRRMDAVLCDHHLRIRNYSTFDGAQLAAALYDVSVPAVLCTDRKSTRLN